MSAVRKTQKSQMEHECEVSHEYCLTDLWYDERARVIRYGLRFNRFLLISTPFSLTCRCSLGAPFKTQVKKSAEQLRAHSMRNLMM